MSREGVALGDRLPLPAYTSSAFAALLGNTASNAQLSIIRTFQKRKNNYVRGKAKLHPRAGWLDPPLTGQSPPTVVESSAEQVLRSFERRSSVKVFIAQVDPLWLQLFGDARRSPLRGLAEDGRRPFWCTYTEYRQHWDVCLGAAILRYCVCLTALRNTCAVHDVQVFTPPPSPRARCFCRPPFSESNASVYRLYARPSS